MENSFNNATVIELNNGKGFAINIHEEGNTITVYGVHHLEDGIAKLGLVGKDTTAITTHGIERMKRFIAASEYSTLKAFIAWCVDKDNNVFKTTLELREGGFYDIVNWAFVDGSDIISLSVKAGESSFKYQDDTWSIDLHANTTARTNVIKVSETALACDNRIAIKFELERHFDVNDFKMDFDIMYSDSLGDDVMYVQSEPEDSICIGRANFYDVNYGKNTMVTCMLDFYAGNLGKALDRRDEFSIRAVPVVDFNVDGGSVLKGFVFASTKLPHNQSCEDKHLHKVTFDDLLFFRSEIFARQVNVVTFVRGKPYVRTGTKILIDEITRGEQNAH